MKNKYAKRARISEAKIREIVRDVAADLTALQAAALSGLNRNTVNRLYRGVRERMLLACEAQRRLFGVVEVDERFFGARRVKGRRGRGAYGKTDRLRHLRAAGPRLYRDRPGLLKAHPPGHHPRPGRPAHRHQLRWLARLPRPGRPRLWPRPRRPCPRRVHQSTVHINGIEGFWGLAKVRLTKFKGLPRHTFHLHLKETEWRYNHRRADKYKCLLQYLRKNPLS